jgi:cytochrome P450
MSEATVDQVPLLHTSDPAFSRSAPEVSQAREAGWYACTDYGIAVLRHRAMTDLINDPRVANGLYKWARLNGVTEGSWSHFFLSNLQNQEGEDHSRLRRLINPALSPRVMDALAPQFAALAEELVDRFHSDGECEFVADFASPYSTRVLCILIGLPHSDWPTIHEWAVALGYALTVNIKEELPRIEAALEELYAYVDRLIVARRAEPGTDLISRLVQIEQDGDRLTADELRIMATLVIFGGIETTRKQLGMAMQAFINHPDQWELLGRRPDLGDSAVNEVMRVNPAVSWITREALEDLVYDGVLIPEGTTIHMFTEAAGTDPSAADEVSFDITATNRPRQFGFGAGIHHCAGHFLARRDMAVALPILARRMREPHVNGEAHWLPRSATTGPIALPISFTPGF